jgi:hypothetical protein
MPETIFRGSRNRPEPIPVTPVDVVDATSPSLPSPATPAAGTRGAEGGADRAGRAPVALPAPKAWERRPPQPLVRVEEPRFLASGSGWTFVQGGYGWALLGGDGEAVARGPAGRGAGSFDPQSGLLFVPDTEGRLRAVRADGGQDAYWVSLFMSGDFSRSFVARAGDSLVVAGIEREQPHGSPHKPSLSCLEAFSVTRPDVGPSGQLRPSDDVAGAVLFTTLSLRVAAAGTSIVAAEPDRLLWFDPTMRVTACVKGTFMPESISVDEAGRAHLVVEEPPERGRRRRSLWVVDREGRRTLNVMLQRPMVQAPVLGPALVGYDHRVYLVGGGQVACWSFDGTLAWARPLTTPVAGGTVTLDGQVLIADGPELVAFDQVGQRRILATFDGPLVTRPVLTDDRAILVATAGELHRLVPADK